MSRQDPREHRFAVVCARGLGDALLSMVLAHNLRCAGHQVTLFSTPLCELKEWFPEVQIAPFPNESDFLSIFSHFHTILAADHSIVRERHHFGNRVVILKEDTFDKRCSLAQNLRTFCMGQLQLPSAVLENGMTPLQGLEWRCHPKRVILHPMSYCKNKNWPAEKYVVLAKALQQEGYSPFFCVSPIEQTEWKNRVDPHQLPYFPNLSTLACFIYESGYFIGNDSGSGHLASALQIPTLTLFARKSYSHLWRPGWGKGSVVTPLGLLPGAHLKHKFWKKFLSVGRVLSHFKKLVNEEGSGR